MKLCIEISPKEQFCVWGGDDFHRDLIFVSSLVNCLCNVLSNKAITISWWLQPDPFTEEQKKKKSCLESYLFFLAFVFGKADVSEINLCCGTYLQKCFWKMKFIKELISCLPVSFPGQLFSLGIEVCCDLMSVLFSVVDCLFCLVSYLMLG